MTAIWRACRGLANSASPYPSSLRPARVSGHAWQSAIGTGPGGRLRVKTGKTQIEHTLSGLLPKADLSRRQAPRSLIAELRCKARTHDPCKTMPEPGAG